jgi:multiple sugar transport system permease protein
LRTAFYLPIVMPGVAAALFWKGMFQPQIGAINVGLRALGLPTPPWLAHPVWALVALMIVRVWRYAGYHMAIFLAGLSRVPQVLYDAARIDGASVWARFWHVTWPLLRPTTALVLTTSFIFSFQVFAPAYVLTGGGPMRGTTTLVYYLYDRAFGFHEMGYGATVGWALVLIVLPLITLGFWLRARRGVSAGDDGLASDSIGLWATRPAGGKRTSQAIRVGLIAALLVGAVLALAPLAWAVARSLNAGPPPWASYEAALRAAPLLRYGLNSVLVATLTAVGQTATGVLAAYAFSRLHFPGRDALFLLFLGALLLPPQVTLLPTFILLRTLGLIDTHAALVVPSLVHPFTIFLIRQSLLGLPVELEDAARVDGCSRLGILWRIAIPYASPAIIAAALFSFLWSWNSFSWPLIALQTPSRYTLPVGLAMLSSELSSDWPTVLAGVTIAMLPVAILFFAAQRLFVRAMEIGSPPAA